MDHTVESAQVFMRSLALNASVEANTILQTTTGTLFVSDGVSAYSAIWYANGHKGTLGQMRDEVTTVAIKPQGEWIYFDDKVKPCGRDQIAAINRDKQEAAEEPKPTTRAERMTVAQESLRRSRTTPPGESTVKPKEKGAVQIHTPAKAKPDTTKLNEMEGFRKNPNKEKGRPTPVATEKKPDFVSLSELFPARRGVPAELPYAISIRCGRQVCFSKRFVNELKGKSFDILLDKETRQLCVSLGAPVYLMGSGKFTMTDFGAYLNSLGDVKRIVFTKDEDGKFYGKF